MRPTRNLPLFRKSDRSFWAIVAGLMIVACGSLACGRQSDKRPLAADDTSKRDRAVAIMPVNYCPAIAGTPTPTGWSDITAPNVTPDMRVAYARTLDFGGQTVSRQQLIKVGAEEPHSTVVLESGACKLELGDYDHGRIIAAVYVEESGYGTYNLHSQWNYLWVDDKVAGTNDKLRVVVVSADGVVRGTKRLIYTPNVHLSHAEEAILGRQLPTTVKSDCASLNPLVQGCWVRTPPPTGYNPSADPYATASQAWLACTTTGCCCTGTKCH